MEYQLNLIVEELQKLNQKCDKILEHIGEAKSVTDNEAKEEVCENCTFYRDCGTRIDFNVDSCDEFIAN